MNKKVLLIFFLLSLIGCKKTNRVNTSEDTNKDSLVFFLEKANNDSVSYNARQAYTKKAIELISKEKNDSMNRVNYFKVANRYYNMDALEDYKSITLLLVEKSLEAKDTMSLIKAYSYMSDYYVTKNISDSTYIYNYKLEKLY
ncbi:MAG: sensor histidine kinase, partial [Pedobacter sp.]